MRNLEKIKQLSSHPLEDILNIEENTTEVIRFERKTELVEYQPFDEKDNEIEAQYQEVADLAISAFKRLDEVMENAEPKFMARLSEVKMQSLTTALGAIEKRQRLKENKDRAIAKAEAINAKGNVTNNALIVLDRNEALKLLQQKMREYGDEEIIDADVVESDTQENKNE